MKAKTKFGIGLLVMGLVTVTLLGLGVAGVSRAQESEPDSNSSSEDNVIEVPKTGEIVITNEGHMPFLPTDAVKEALDTAVTNNILTQEQADQILADAQSSAEEMRPDVVFEGAVMGEGVEGGLMIRPFPPHAQFHFHPGVPGRPFAMPEFGREIHGDHMGGFIHALRQAVTDGALTQEAMNQILTDFAEFAGDNVTAEIPEDSEGDVFIAINGLAEELQTAWQEALDKAVEDGVLTADQAASILEKATTPPAFPPIHPPIFHFNGAPMELPQGLGNFTFEFDGEGFIVPNDPSTEG